MKLKGSKRPFGSGARAATKRQPAPTPKPEGGWPACHYKGCALDGRNTHFCVTCEKIHGDGSPKVHAVHYCPLHRDAGLSAIKRHALVKHPSNLLRVIGAGLAGEKIDG